LYLPFSLLTFTPYSLSFQDFSFGLGAFILLRERFYLALNSVVIGVLLADRVSSNMPTQQDIDCASLARDALFPPKINQDGSHPAQFPASEALEKIRDSQMAAHPERAASSFFPRRVVVVRDIATSALKWNGQPEVSHNDASVEAIPNLLSVRCMQCGTSNDRDAFVRKDSDTLFREIVLCSNRLLQRDYDHSRMPLAHQSLTVLQEVLAHQLTKVGDQLERERTNATTGELTCQELAATEIRAARAAECYYSKAGNQVTRGSALGTYGYSTFPTFVQNVLRNRCIRFVATSAVEKSEFGREGGKCVTQVFEDANRD
jgi:hypothetical protein